MNFSNKFIPKKPPKLLTQVAKLMMSKLNSSQFNLILYVINDAAVAYKGVIPTDRWKEPYMPAEELKFEIESGVEFYGLKKKRKLNRRYGNSTRQGRHINPTCLRAHKPPTQRSRKKTAQTPYGFNADKHSFGWNLEGSLLGTRFLR